jgi:hypothetical protein
VIGSTRSLRVFAYTVPTDMRKGFDGLYGMFRCQEKLSELCSRVRQS